MFQEIDNSLNAKGTSSAPCSSTGASALTQFLVNLESESACFSVKDCQIVADNAHLSTSLHDASVQMSVSLAVSVSLRNSRSSRSRQGRRSSRSSRVRQCQSEELDNSTGSSDAEDAPFCRWESYPAPVVTRSASPQRHTTTSSRPAQAPLRRAGTYPPTVSDTAIKSSRRPPRRPSRRSSLTKPIPKLEHNEKEALKSELGFDNDDYLAQGMAEMRKLAAELQDDSSCQSDASTDSDTISSSSTGSGKESSGKSSGEEDELSSMYCILSY